MTKDVTLNLDEFSQRALERFARDGDGSAARAAQMASMYYLADRDSGRPAWRVPTFATASEQPRRLRVPFDESTWEALSREAESQRVSTEVLAVHAVLYFLADIDSGRLAGSLGDALDGIDESRFRR
jgi:hypothetical protein